MVAARIEPELHPNVIDARSVVAFHIEENQVPDPQAREVRYLRFGILNEDHSGRGFVDLKRPPWHRALIRPRIQANRNTIRIPRSR